MTEIKVVPVTYCIFDPTQTKVCPKSCNLNWMVQYANEIGSKFDPSKEPDITLLPECKIEKDSAN